MTPAWRATAIEVVPRLFVATALVALSVHPDLRHHALHDDALDWAPLRFGIWALGVLGLVGAAWRVARAAPWAPRREPARPATTERGAALAVAAEVVALFVVLAVALRAHAAWGVVANPERVPSGFDYNVYLLNTIAVATGDWSLFNGDKRSLHAFVVAALTGRGDLVSTMIDVSGVSAAALPVVAWLIARQGAGPVAGLLAATLTLAHPLAYPYGTQTTAYAMFYMLIGLAIAAGLWAVRRPSTGTAALAGLTAGLALATQEKTVVVLGPVVACALVVAAPGWLARALTRGPSPRPAAFVGRVALALAVCGAIVTITRPPTGYTPFVSLISNQRQEVHDHLPYPWPTVRVPDLKDPAGIRAWLPRPLWDGEVESYAAALLTPPDSLSLRLSRRDEPGARWRIVPRTTIAPVEDRMRSNLREFRRALGALPWAGAWLVVAGTASLLVFGGAGARTAAGAFAAFASGYAPLTLRFGEHYYPHLLPVAAALSAAGLERLVRWLLPRPLRAAGLAVIGAVVACYAIDVWNGTPDAWRAPRLPFPPPAAEVPADPGDYGRSLRAVAAWLDTRDPTTPLVDCLPGGLLLVRPWDPRLPHAAHTSSCQAGLAAAAPGTLLVTSSHAEFRDPGLPRTEALVRDPAWTVVWGFDPYRGAFTRAPSPIGSSAIVVFAPRAAAP